MRIIVVAALVAAAALAQTPTPSYWRLNADGTIGPRNGRSVAIGTTLLTSAMGYCSAGTWRYGACEVKTTITYAQLVAAATTQQFTLLTLPANAKITGITIYHTAAFSGGNLTALNVSMGRTGTPNDYVLPYDIFQASATTTRYDDGGHFGLDMASHAVAAKFSGTFSAGNFGDGETTTLTTGSVTIWVRYIVLT